MKILLVEDNEFVRTLIGDQLGAEGYTVESMGNAEDALAALIDGDYNLLITDIVLPERDGGELMKAVRQRGIDIPILAITGGVENAVEDYANYADMFADKTLVKPIKKAVLLETVRGMLAQAA